MTNRQTFKRNKSAIQKVLERPQTKHVFLLDKRKGYLKFDWRSPTIFKVTVKETVLLFPNSYLTSVSSNINYHVTLLLSADVHETELWILSQRVFLKYRVSSSVFACFSSNQKCTITDLHTNPAASSSRWHWYQIDVVGLVCGDNDTHKAWCQHVKALQRCSLRCSLASCYQIC